MNTVRALFLNDQAGSVASILKRNYALKSDLKIKWVRPEPVPAYKPEKSGDLEGYKKIDGNQFILEFKDSKELQTADENVKKLFTLEFAPLKFANRYYFTQLIEKVKRHDYDVGSVEVKIAKWTGGIRAMQDIMERFPRDKKRKVRLTELIDRRKKQLKYLRRWDYKKFEWLLEALDIVYKPPPNVMEKVTRKASMRKLTDQYCNSLKDDRLNKYKLFLESEQPAFIEEKIRALQFIREEQKDCGVEVTVTEDEINVLKNQLEQMKRKLDTIEE